MEFNRLLCILLNLVMGSEVYVYTCLLGGHVYKKNILYIYARKTFFLFFINISLS